MSMCGVTNDRPDGTQSRQSAICRGTDSPCAVCQGLAGARVVHSDELLQGQRELRIVHAGQVYRLLRTKNDKLILHK